MLYLYHSNCLNELKDIMLQQLSGQQADVFESEKILVQTPGMKRWLQQQISLACGVATNLEFPLPSRFIWEVFLGQFNDVARLSSYDAEVLRWRLMGLLKEHEKDKQLSPLYGYLEKDDQGVTRFQLAEKIARLFDQYLVYRGDMIQRWESSGAVDSVTESVQCYLWGLLRKQKSGPHRAELISRLIARLDSGKIDMSQLPNRLFVFAISALSPLYMNVLAALGQRLDVHIFNLNPCEHYWGDIESNKEQLKRGELPVGENELLASLGQQGRDYIDQYYDIPYDFVEAKHFVDIKPQNLLGRIKKDILLLTRNEEAVDHSNDDSIRVVNCYSELRELQVLHDRLLDLLNKDETLQAHDIVIMCPDINTLAPYVEAVFGEQPEHKQIPYSISDHSISSSTPLLQTILEWVNLLSSRFTVNEVLAWLELPALRRAYKLGSEEIEVIRFWCQSNHIHWGINKTFKSQRNLGDESSNTWQYGINRLLTAYVMDETAKVFCGHVAAESIINNTEFYSLGQFQKFLDDLQHWLTVLSEPASINEWQRRINDLIEKFLLLDDDEEWLLKPLRDELADWQLQAEQAVFEEALDAALVHKILQGAVTQGTTHNRYLTGGVNFCNLIPMRTLPFRVVCLIGMGDKQFPRTEAAVQLDLIGIHPRKGDRSRREDDRYMFLQSMLSATDLFYISYVGKNRKDDAILQPSVVVTELIEHIGQTTGVCLDVETTPLQPFSKQNFKDGSYADLWYINDDRDRMPEFNQPIEVAKTEGILSLNEIILFYQNPAKYFMKNRINTALHEYTLALQDEEVFTLDALQKYQLNNRLIDELLKSGEVNANSYLNSGELGEANTGRVQFEDHYKIACEHAQLISSQENFIGKTHFEADLKIGDIEIHGIINSYSDQGLLQSIPSDLKGKHAFSMWVQHCFFSATGNPTFCEFFSKDKISMFRLLEPELARQILQQLLNGFTQGCKRILPFYVNTSYEYENLKRDKNAGEALAKIESLWSGDNFTEFYEAQDIYIQTSLKNQCNQEDSFADEFFELSERYMSPLLDNIESKKL